MHTTINRKKNISNLKIGVKIISHRILRLMKRKKTKLQALFNKVSTIRRYSPTHRIRSMNQIVIANQQHIIVIRAKNSPRTLPNPEILDKLISF